MQNYHAVEIRLKSDIAEMARLDEILTSSALLAASTGDIVHHERYHAHVGQLDDVIEAALSTYDSAKVDAMLRETEQANRWLVDVERRALAASTQGPFPEAYALLRSDAYHRQKKTYQAGLDAAMAEIGVIATRKRERATNIVILLGILGVCATVASARIVLRQRQERHATDRQRKQMQLMQGLIGTFMDLQNNLLNNMVYFRTKAAHGLSFDDTDVRLIDEEIERAKGKLAEIAETGIGTTRDLGGIVVYEPQGAGDTVAA